jgi:RNA polymerase sigma-70 factor (ECF subfamily)
MKVHEKMLNNFLLAISEGSVEDLIDLLKEDIMLFADGGGTTFSVKGKRLTAFAKPIGGRENVSRLLLTVVPQFQETIPDFSQEIIFANGLPSIISYSGNMPISLVSLEQDGEQIRNIYVQTNPEKLKRFIKD